MRKIIPFLFLLIFSFWPVQATDYFGQLTGTGSYDGSNSGYTFANDTTVYTCPSSGLKKVVSLEAYMKSGSGTGNGSFRMAVYNTAMDTLFAQHSMLVSVPGTWSSGDWRGGTTIIEQFYPLSGGANYRIVLSIYQNDPAVNYANARSKSQSSTTHYKDFPNTLTLSSTYSKLMMVRCGVDTWDGIDTTYTPVQMICNFETGSLGDTIKPSNLLTGTTPGGNGTWTASLICTFIDTAHRNFGSNRFFGTFGTKYYDTAGTRSYRFDHNNRMESSLFTFTKGYDSVSAGFFWKSTLPVNNYDAHTFVNIGDNIERVNFGIVNENTDSLPSQLEVATHLTPSINLARNTWYWVCIRYNIAAKHASLGIYDATTYSKLDSVVDTIVNPTAATILKFGKTGGDTKYYPGNTYFDNIVVDYRTAKYPLIPKYNGLSTKLCTLVVIAATGGTVSRATIIDSTSRTFRDTATANTSYLFYKWTVRHGGVTFADSMSRFAAMTVTASDTVDATFRARPTYTLTMAAGTGGTVLPATGSVDSAASTAISASPGTHYIFQKWTRSSTAATIADSTSATTTVILTGAATVTGNFTCVAPTISYATKITANYKTAITPQSATIGGGGADSVKAITTLPAGLTCTKTGVNAGQITGTPTVLAAKAGYLIRAYGCDSADTYDTITVSDNVPVITSATPSHRPTTTAGNDTLRGSWLANIDTVWYGTTASTTFWAQTDTTAIVAIPNHAAGVVSIIARNTAGSDSLVNGFEYKNLWINSVTPYRVKAGDTVSIHAAYGLGTSGLGIVVDDSTATIITGYVDTLAKFIAPGYLTGVKKVTATNTGSDTCSSNINYTVSTKNKQVYRYFIQGE